MRSLSSQETLIAKDGADLFAEVELAKFRDRIIQKLAALGSHRPIFLKHPLSALFLPQICKVFNARLIYVMRPIIEIERTRIRRHWGPNLGAKGAEIIYAHMFRTLVNDAFPTFIVRYTELIAAPFEHVRDLTEFAGLENTEDAIQRAAAFIKSPIPDPGKYDGPPGADPMITME